MINAIKFNRTSRKTQNTRYEKGSLPTTLCYCIAVSHDQVAYAKLDRASDPTAWKTKEDDQDNIPVDDDNTKLNALGFLMDLINNQQKEIDALETPAAFYINNKFVANDINDGNYLYMLLTGRDRNGKPVDEEELEMWAEFKELYFKNLEKIVFINSTRIYDPKRPPITQEEQFIAKVWAMLPNVEGRQYTRIE